MYCLKMPRVVHVEVRTWRKGVASQGIIPVNARWSRGTDAMERSL
jgi:hypothetical protein